MLAGIARIAGRTHFLRTITVPDTLDRIRTCDLRFIKGAPGRGSQGNRRSIQLSYEGALF
jgi:hypothetical protein